MAQSPSSDAQLAVQNVAKTDHGGTDGYKHLWQEVQAEQKKLSPADFHTYEQDVASDLKTAGLLPEFSLEYGATLAQGGPVSKSLLNDISSANQDPLIGQMVSGLEHTMGSKSSVGGGALSRDIEGDRSYASNREKLAPLFEEYPVESNGKTTQQSLLQFIDSDLGDGGNGQITTQKLERYLQVAMSGGVPQTEMFSKSNITYVKGLLADGVKLQNSDGKTYTLKAEQGEGDYSKGICTGNIAAACHMTDYQLGDASTSQRQQDYAKMEQEYDNRTASNKAGVSDYPASDTAGGGGGATQSSTSESAQASADATKIDNAPDTTLRNSSKTLMAGAIQAEAKELQAGKISQSDFNQYLADLKTDLTNKTVAGEVAADGAEAEQTGTKAASDAKAVEDAKCSNAAALLKSDINKAFQSVRNGKMSDTAYDEYVSDLGSDLARGGHVQLAREANPDSVQGEKIAREAASSAQEVEHDPDANSKQSMLESEIQNQYKKVQDGTMSAGDFDQYVSDLTSDLTKKRDDGLAASAQKDGAALQDVSTKAESDAKEVENAPGTNSYDSAPALLAGVIQGAYEGVKDGTMTSAEFKSYVSDLSKDLRSDGHPDLAGNATTDGEACLNEKTSAKSSTAQSESAIAQKAAADTTAVENSADAPAVLKDVIDGAYDQVKDGSMTSAEFKSYVSDLSTDLKKAGHPDLASNAKTDGEECLSSISTASAITKKAADDTIAVESSADAPAVLNDVINGAYDQVKAGSMTSAEFKSYVGDLSADLQKAGHPDLSNNAKTDGAECEKTGSADSNAEAKKQVLDDATVQAGDGYWQVAERLTKLVTGNQDPSDSEISKVWLQLMNIDNASASNDVQINEHLLNANDWQKFLKNISQDGVQLNKTYTDAA